LKRLLLFILAVETVSVAVSGNVSSAEKTETFEGTVSVSLTRSGPDTTQFLFTRKGNHLRIENTDRSKLAPVNVVDLTANRLTIIYPHNSSFVVVDLKRNEAPSGPPNFPPGFPAPPNVGQAGAPPRPGPAISPPSGFPTPPPMPSMPPLPNNPMAAAPPNMPVTPAQGFGGTPELKKTDKAKKIQEFDCVLYTISDRMETFEIWATADSALFPFRLIQANYLNRRFGPRMLEEQWIELLQKQSLFPLEVTLRRDLHLRPESPAGAHSAATAGETPDQGQEQLSLKVEKIEKKKIDNEKLFQSPGGYFEIQSAG
jgi:hypothetical protein